MTLQEFYSVVGGDYQDAINRMMMESMLRKFLAKFPSDPSYANLEQALADGNREEAFRAAHTINGLFLTL